MALENKDKFEKYLATLFSELTLVNTIFEVFVHLNTRKEDRLEEMNIAPAFFGITFYCLLSESIIILSKLFENYGGKKRSDRDIINFLNFVEQNLDLFPQDEPTLTKFNCKYQVNGKLINEQKELIDKKIDTLNNLFHWRDKYYAHFDKKYFLEKELLGQEVELTPADIRSLIILAKEILNKISAAYSGNVNDVEAINQNDVDNILNILHRYKQK